MNKRLETSEPDGLKMLREPFPAHQISKLCKPYSKESQKGNCKACGGYHGLPAVTLDYVGHAAFAAWRNSGQGIMTERNPVG